MNRDADADRYQKLKQKMVGLVNACTCTQHSMRKFIECQLVSMREIHKQATVCVCIIKMSSTFTGCNSQMSYFFYCSVAVTPETQPVPENREWYVV